MNLCKMFAEVLQIRSFCLNVHETMKYATIRLKWKTALTANMRKIRWKAMQKTIAALRQTSVYITSNMYITSENSSDEEIYPWITLINDTATKVRAQYHDMLQALLMKGHDENEAK